jgi:hypothetical protein
VTSPARPRQRAAPSKVRPYVITRGRTCSSRGLGVETLVRTVAFDAELASTLLPEEYKIYHKCQEAQCIAELVTVLLLTLGMVRVVVDDLSRRGLVEILPAGYEGISMMELLKRTRDGLANLAR